MDERVKQMVHIGNDDNQDSEEYMADLSTRN